MEFLGRVLVSTQTAIWHLRKKLVTLNLILCLAVCPCVCVCLCVLGACVETACVCTHICIYCMFTRCHPVVLKIFLCVISGPYFIFYFFDTAALQYFFYLSSDESLVCSRIKKN